MAHTVTPDKSGPNTSLMIRGAIWIAIGALVAAALVCVVWVLVGDQQGLIGRAFLTIVLLAAFAGIAILEAGLAPRREDWVALLSMLTWIVALLVGAVKIWLPEERYAYGLHAFDGMERFFQLLLVIAILQLALLHVRLFRRAATRYVTVMTRVIVYATFVFLGLLVGMLVFYLTFPDAFFYAELYWRIVVALTILAAVGTMLIPLLNVLFAPKRPRTATPPLMSSAALGQVASPLTGAQPWPVYADGRTPLPMLPDGNPDWNAYYTGVPAPGAVVFAAPDAAPVPGISASAGGHSVAGSSVAESSPAEQAAPPTPDSADAPAAPSFPPAPPTAPRS